jgi:hypothetical protein
MVTAESEDDYRRRQIQAIAAGLPRDRLAPNPWRCYTCVAGLLCALDAEQAFDAGWRVFERRLFCPRCVGRWMAASDGGGV